MSIIWNTFLTILLHHITDVRKASKTLTRKHGKSEQELLFSFLFYAVQELLSLSLALPIVTDIIHCQSKNRKTCLKRILCCLGEDNANNYWLDLLAMFYHQRLVLINGNVILLNVLKVKSLTSLFTISLIFFYFLFFISHSLKFAYYSFLK